MRKTHLYALKPEGTSHLATREGTSDTFHEQCRNWVEKHACPLLVIIDADDTHPEHVKAFYPRDPDTRQAWQKGYAQSGFMHERNASVFADDIDTVWTKEEYNAHRRKLTEQAPFKASHEFLRTAETETASITMPASAVPKKVLPDCQCNAEIEPYFRTYSNGTKHVYLACVQCLKSTARAVKKSLLPPEILKALREKERNHDRKH